MLDVDIWVDISHDPAANQGILSIILTAQRKPPIRPVPDVEALHHVLEADRRDLQTRGGHIIRVIDRQVGDEVPAPPNGGLAGGVGVLDPVELVRVRQAMARVGVCAGRQPPESLSMSDQ